MFYNHGNLGNISGVFTQEVLDTLSDFRGLRLTRRLEGSDAVLLGIIETPSKSLKSVEVLTYKRASNTFGESVLGEGREDFNTPTVNQVNLNLRVIVLKHPTKEEINFFQKSITEKALSSKIIFNEKIPLSGSYNLKELDGSSLMVLNSQNTGVQKQLINQLAKDAANSFKDMILYAF